MGRRTRRQKRVMPRDGRMVGGCYQSEYMLGAQVGEAVRRGDLDMLPLSVRAPTFHQLRDNGYDVPRVLPEPSVVEVQKQIGKEQTGATMRVRLSPKVHYSRGTLRTLAQANAADSEVPAYWPAIHVSQWQRHTYPGAPLSQSSAFWSGVKSVGATTGPESRLSAAQFQQLVSLTKAEAERKGVDTAQWFKLGGTWTGLAKALDKA